MPDWKLFRELREVTLERFCRRVLETLDRFQQEDSRSYHERYLDLYKWLRGRDEELAGAFNDPRRSRMFQQLAAIVALDLLTPDELKRLTPASRETVESLAGLFSDWIMRAAA